MHDRVLMRAEWDSKFGRKLRVYTPLQVLDCWFSPKHLVNRTATDQTKQHYSPHCIHSPARRIHSTPATSLAPAYTAHTNAHRQAPLTHTHPHITTTVAQPPPPPPPSRPPPPHPPLTCPRRLPPQARSEEARLVLEEVGVARVGRVRLRAGSRRLHLRLAGWTTDRPPVARRFANP